MDTSHSGFVVLGLEGDSAPSRAFHKPTGAEIPLASVQVGTKEAPAWERLFSTPMLTNGDGRQDVQMQNPGDTGGARGGARHMQVTASSNGVVHRDRATCWGSCMSLVGNSFGQVK